jgi:AcrR family transcriptional regulator
MPRTSDKRERLVVAAKDLIHRQGFGQTTLADIAAAAGVPLGNVYYYFKTKEEIGAAVVDQRLADFHALFRAWEEYPDPRTRLLALLDLLDSVQEAVASHGCPIGSLCQELDKGRSPLAEKADGVIKVQVAWATEQFRRLGRPNAAELALELVVGVHGASLVAHALRDPAVLAEKIRRMREWVVAV